MNEFSDIDSWLNGDAARKDEARPAGDDEGRFAPIDSYEPGPSARTIIPQPERQSAFACITELGDDAPPERRWTVPGMIPASTVTMLGGDGGTGKSLLSLQLAIAIATGGTWLGRKFDPDGVLYVTAEDERDEVHRRAYDITRASGIKISGLGNLMFRSLAGEDALLATVDQRIGILQTTPLFDELSDYVDQLCPRLIVLDTLADLFPGNENDRAQARQFIGILRGLAMRSSAAVLLLSHPSLSGLNSGSGTSGSTAWNNSVRSRMYLTRVQDQGYEADTKARVLKIMKANYGDIGDEIACHYDDGIFVLDHVDTGLDRMAISAKAERVFLKLLGEFTDQGRRVNHAGGQTYAPNVFAANPGAEGVTARAFRSAMEELLRADKISIKEDGPPSKRRQFLAVEK